MNFYFVFDFGCENARQVRTREPVEIGQEIELENGFLYRVSRKLTKVSYKYGEYTQTDTLYILSKLKMYHYELQTPI